MFLHFNFWNSTQVPGRGVACANMFARLKRPLLRNSPQRCLKKIFDVHNVSSCLDYKRSSPQMPFSPAFLFSCCDSKEKTFGVILTKGYFKSGQRWINRDVGLVSLQYLLSANVGSLFRRYLSRRPTIFVKETDVIFRAVSNWCCVCVCRVVKVENMIKFVWDKVLG